MESLTRLGLFVFAYTTILILACIINNCPIKYFVGYTFLFITTCLGGWLYYCHYIDRDSSKGLKEVLYVMTFLTSFTSVFGFLLQDV